MLVAAWCDDCHGPLSKVSGWDAKLGADCGRKWVCEGPGAQYVRLGDGGERKVLWYWAVLTLGPQSTGLAPSQEHVAHAHPHQPLCGHAPSLHPWTVFEPHWISLVHPCRASRVKGGGLQAVLWVPESHLAADGIAAPLAPSSLAEAMRTLGGWDFLIQLYAVGGLCPESPSFQPTLSTIMTTPSHPACYTRQHSGHLDC